MSEASKAAFGWPAELTHAPQSPEVTTGNQFQAACRCGYAGKAGSTPSHAYNSTKTHALMANARERGEPLPNIPGAAVAANNHEPVAKTPRAPRAPRDAGSLSPCGCGCEELSKGLFRPGHDARLLSRLVKSAKDGSPRDDVLAEFDKVGASDKLRAKLVGRLDAAGVA